MDTSVAAIARAPIAGAPARAGSRTPADRNADTTTPTANPVPIPDSAPSAWSAGPLGTDTPARRSSSATARSGTPLAGRPVRAMSAYAAAVSSVLPAAPARSPLRSVVVMTHAYPTPGRTIAIPLPGQ